MRRALAIWEAAVGENHPKVASALSNLANLLHATNRLAEAEPLMDRALTIDEKCFSSDHPRVAIRLNNLAIFLDSAKRPTEAEPLMRRALEIFTASLGPDHPNTKKVAENYTKLLVKIEAAKP